MPLSMLATSMLSMLELSSVLVVLVLGDFELQPAINKAAIKAETNANFFM